MFWLFFESRDQKKVRLAAKYLDGIRPGWAFQINPITLNLMNASRCICGQLGLNWQYHYQALRRKHGLVTVVGVFTNHMLEPLWLEEIAKRIPETVPDERKEVPSPVHA